jgi:hypothetical protein
MRTLAAVLSLAAVSFAADSWTVKSWNPTPEPLDVVEGRLDVDLTGVLPEHWAVTVVPLTAKNAGASISAGAVELDGPFVEGVTTIDQQRIERKPGVARIATISSEAGLAVCIVVPAGTKVRVLHDDLLVGGSSDGFVMRDGAMIARNPRVCTSVPALQQALSAQ